MNYLKLINQFWMLRRSKRITSKQTDLYFFLLKECNERGWENPFECSNKSIIVSIDMQEPTLIDARNRLKQLGLIEFRGGRRNEASPVYELLYLNHLSRNRGEPLVETEEGLKLNDEHYNINKTETKGKRKREVGADAPAPKSFKTFSEQEFIDEIGNFKEKYSSDLLNAFYKYWKEKNARGKMRFQLEDTWETSLRLETWHRRENDKTRKNGTYQQTPGKQFTGSKKSEGANRLAKELGADLGFFGEGTADVNGQVPK